jgi:hypothetical protein
MDTNMLVIATALALGAPVLLAWFGRRGVLQPHPVQPLDPVTVRRLAFMRWLR